MKKLSSLIILVLLTLAVIFIVSGCEPAEKVTYVCPMHPEIVSDKPGDCPKCGMKLKARQPCHCLPKNKEAEN